MSGARQPGGFRPGELDSAADGRDIEPELLGTARELARLAAGEDVGPSPGFADRVMAAVNREPPPRPLVAAFGAARRRRPLAALRALGELWRVAFTGGRPLSVRLPATLLVALLAVGSVGAGALGAGAFAGLLGPAPDAKPAVSPSSPPSASPVASPSPDPVSSPSAPASPALGKSSGPVVEPAVSASPTPSDTPEPTGAAIGTPAATDDRSPRPSATPRPSERPSPSPAATETPGPSGDPTGDD